MVLAGLQEVFSALTEGAMKLVRRTFFRVSCHVFITRVRREKCLKIL